MPLLTPDPTFYPSPALATQSPAEKLAYVTLISPGRGNVPRERVRVFAAGPTAALPEPKVRVLRSSQPGVSLENTPPKLPELHVEREDFTDCPVVQ